MAETMPELRGGWPLIFKGSPAPAYRDVPHVIRENRLPCLRPKLSSGRDRYRSVSKPASGN